MKKYFILLMLTFSVGLLNGCGSEDDIKDAIDTIRNTPNNNTDTESTPQTLDDPAVPESDKKDTPEGENKDKDQNGNTNPQQPKTLQLSDLQDSYYGKVYDLQNKPIDLPVDKIPNLQAELKKEIATALTPSTQELYQQIENDFKKQLKTSNHFDSLIFNNALIGSMLAEAKTTPKMRPIWQKHHQILRQQTFERLPPFNARTIEALLRFLRENDLYRHVGLSDRLERGSYIRQCQDAGVPIPPDWGSGDWDYQGIQSRTFISNNLDTEVWAYEDPHVDGSCMALPRKTSSGSIQLLGIICQSDTTGKACFWDNVDGDTGARLTGSSATNMQISELQNGNTLSENCTQCHRGKNVFLIHPNETIDISRNGYDTDPQIRYTPLSSQAAWQNPTPHDAQGSGPLCSTCHEIPSLGRSYCNSVLQNGASITMPSVADPAGWPPALGPYEDHVNALRAACP